MVSAAAGEGSLPSGCMALSLASVPFLPTFDNAAAIIKLLNDGGTHAYVSVIDTFLETHIIIGLEDSISDGVTSTIECMALGVLNERFLAPQPERNGQSAYHNKLAYIEGYDCEDNLPHYKNSSLDEGNDEFTGEVLGVKTTPPVPPIIPIVPYLTDGDVENMKVSDLKDKLKKSG